MRILLIFIGIILLIFIGFSGFWWKASSFSVGPINGEVIDAMTGKPLSGILISLRIFGTAPSLHSTGWESNRETYNRSDGTFHFPLVTERKNFLATIDSIELEINERSIVNEESFDDALYYLIHPADNTRFISARENGTEGYTYVLASYEEPVSILNWKPTFKLKFSLVPLNKPLSIEYCKSMKDQPAQRRCLHHLAATNSRSLNDVAASFKNQLDFDRYLYLKYRHLVFADCDLPMGERRIGDKIIFGRESDCDSVLAAEKRKVDACTSLVREEGQPDPNYRKDRCLLYAGLDLKDQSFCQQISEQRDRELCLSILGEFRNLNLKG